MKIQDLINDAGVTIPQQVDQPMELLTHAEEMKPMFDQATPEEQLQFIRILIG